jgi:DNA-binding response OmpR family regulator
VNEPLALLLCARGLIATQLAERLEALRYRKRVITEPGDLKSVALTEKAMVVLADLDGNEDAVIEAVQQLRADSAAAHIPVIGFRRELDESLQNLVLGRGFTIAVNDGAMLSHVAQLLDRALDVS